MPSAEPVHLGVYPSADAVHVVSSLGQRTAFSGDVRNGSEDWLELTTYGLPLPDPHLLYGCVALPAGADVPERRRRLQDAARLAGWDGLVVVSALTAARRSLLGPRPAQDPEPSRAAPPPPIVIVDRELTSVGVFEGGRCQDDPIRPIAGREAREVAVSLRCLLKQRPRSELRQALQRVVVAGDASEIERVGRRSYEHELEALGVAQVEFATDPFLVANGACDLAAETDPELWRRLRRRRR